MQPNRNYEKFAIWLMSMVCGVPFHAFVAMAWWDWFMVPHGITALTFSQAIVLRFAAALLRVSADSNTLKVNAIHKVLIAVVPAYRFDDFGDYLNRCVGWAIVAPMVFLGVGWILQRLLTT